jgi:hypothetical protein
MSANSARELALNIFHAAGKLHASTFGLESDLGRSLFVEAVADILRDLDRLADAVDRGHELAASGEIDQHRRSP